MISVVTTTYNNYDELLATVDSLKGIRPIEHIVINGGTCPKTREFLKLHSGQSISEPDKGISDAFNKGIQLSTGIAITFLNSGDLLIDKEYYSNVDEIFRKSKDIGFVYSDHIFEDRLCGAIRRPPSFDVIGRGTPFCHQTMVVRREIFNEIGEFDLSQKICMDYDHICRMEKRGIKGYYYSSPTIKMSGEGISTYKEYLAIIEAGRILYKYRLFTPRNTWGFIRRVILYLGRVILNNIGLRELLKKLKLRKYSQK